MRALTFGLLSVSVLAMQSVASAQSLSGLSSTTSLAAKTTPTGYQLTGIAIAHTTCNVNAFQSLTTPVGTPANVFLAISYYKGQICGQMIGPAPMAPLDVTTTSVPKSVTIFTATGRKVIVMDAPAQSTATKATVKSTPPATTGQGVDEQHPGGK